jgi:hypothetical protein
VGATARSLKQGPSSLTPFVQDCAPSLFRAAERPNDIATGPDSHGHAAVA